jgi:predicted permease
LIFARRIDLNVMLAQGGRTAGRSPRQRRTRSALLVGQVTITVVLLVGAALFVLSFSRLIHAPLGFDPADRVALRVTLAGSRYADDAAVVRFADRLLEEGRAIPGVRDAAVASSSPLASGPSARFVVMDRERPARGDEPSALMRSVSPVYFRTLGTRVVEGREFSAADVPGAPRVAIVNETLAQRLFPGASPIGQRLELLPGARAAWTRRPGPLVIVGVTENVKNVGLNEVEFNGLYLPFAQAPAPSLELLAAAGTALSGLSEPLRAAVARVDTALPVTRITTLTDRVDSALQDDRFNLILIAFFAVAAVLLAAVGIYGAMACGVQERTREFGVRLALGARPAAIVRAALWEAARLGIAGGLCGVAATLIVARLLGNALYLVPGEHNGLLYGVTTTDPLAIGAAVAIVIVVATMSGLVPARQATRVSPLVALRTE